MGDKTRGIYNKFEVHRTDGQHRPGKKHHDCRYFVLDLTHDKHAQAALEAYAAACKAEYPLLAADLQHQLNEMDAQGFAWTSSSDASR